jgi:hypothetical protein
MTSNSVAESNSIASGVKAVAIAFIFILGYLNVRLAFQIGTFKTIFADMLAPSRPLPIVTTFIIEHQLLFIILAFLIPIFAGAIALRDKNNKRALFLIAGLMLLTFVQLHFMWSGLCAPLMSIVIGLQSGI